MIYNWQHKTWESIAGLRQRMPHALLLHGQPGIGKADFAREFAQSLMCDTPADHGFACGVCTSCRWFRQGSHPDFRLLEPADDAADNLDENGREEGRSNEDKPKKKNHITVHQVRKLGDFLNLSTHRHGLHIVLLSPAESLNPSAASALLKMLEEPPPSTLFLLVTQQPQRLLPTIRSRCHKISMPPPTRQAAEEWLATQGIQDISQRLSYAGGSPLAAFLSDKEMEDRRETLHKMLMQGRKLDPLATTMACSKVGVTEFVSVLQKWAYDLLALKLIGQARYHVHPSSSMQGLAMSVDLAKLLGFQRALGEACKHVKHPLNAELQMENLLIQYVRIYQ